MKPPSHLVGLKLWSFSLIGFFFLFSSLSNAQNEAILKNYFEGKMVRLKIDMPATSQGVDVHVDEIKPLDYDEYTGRIKKKGIALYVGDEIMVTKIKTKKKHIEFQLGGGGYGTFGDESTHVSVPFLGKSETEKNLEKSIKAESDESTKKKMEAELSDLRKARQIEQERLNMEAEQARAAKEGRVRSLAMQSGSRFNIRFKNNLTARDMQPESILAALSEYLEMVDAHTAAIDSPGEKHSGQLYKGMLWEDVASLMGAPQSIDQRMEGTLKVMTCVFEKDNQQITTEFVEGVLIKYIISSN